jgi:catechol 2,3-dioxygenase-like lactoylglutathione lyase family enzyme
MSGVSFGNHSAVVVPRAEQDRMRQFYRDILGCEIVRQTDEKDDFRLGGNFYIGVLYEDEGVALDESSKLKAIYLELQDTHLYFQAPGGQVWRLVGAGEDLSRYEGTDHRELPSVFD